MPLIAITAMRWPATTGCLAADMNDYVTKPIDRARLLSTIARCSARAS